MKLTKREVALLLCSIDYELNEESEIELESLTNKILLELDEDSVFDIAEKLGFIEN